MFVPVERRRPVRVCFPESVIVGVWVCGDACGCVGMRNLQATLHGLVSETAVGTALLWSSKLDAGGNQKAPNCHAYLIQVCRPSPTDNAKPSGQSKIAGPVPTQTYIHTLTHSRTHTTTLTGVVHAPLVKWLGHGVGHVPHRRPNRCQW